MSKKIDSFFTLQNVPERWILCPKHGELIPGTHFVPLKTPLSEKFNNILYEGHRFTPKDFVEAQAAKGRSVVGIFSFANTDKRYDVSEFGGASVKFIKCGQSVPTDEHFSRFMECMNEFNEKIRSDDDIIGIHCTHGFNRTGFIIVRYLVQVNRMKLIDALNLFKEYRPPGIYKEDYLKKLFEIYGEEMTYHSPGKGKDLWAFPSPELLNHYEEERIIPEDSETTTLVGVKVASMSFTKEIIDEIKKICNSESKNYFPGSQPVTLERGMIHLLEENKTYRATYKSDGIRYFLFAYKGKSYLIDRKFEIREVKSVLVNRKGELLKRTLLDGELVTEKDDNGNVYHNFLIFDIIEFEEFKLMENDWDTRMDYVSKGICRFREIFMKSNPEMFDNEDFRVSNKKQWKLNRLHKLQLYIKNKVRHDTDGVIFTPLSMLYIVDKCVEILKWKPIELNSTDFIALLHNGILYLGVRNNYDKKQPDIPISILDIPNDEYKSKLDKAIIECSFDKRTLAWKPLRICTDKTNPNAYSTFSSVYESILDDFSLEFLQEKFGYDNTEDPNDLDL